MPSIDSIKIGNTIYDLSATATIPHYYAQSFNFKNYVGIGYKLGNNGQSSDATIPVIESIRMNAQNTLEMNGGNISIKGMESLNIVSLGTQEPYLSCALGSTTTYNGSLSGYVRQVVDDYVNPQLTTLLS